MSQNNIMPKTRDNVTHNSGWIQDALPAFVINKNFKINFKHIDVDTYKIIKFILNKTKKNLTENYVIVFDVFLILMNGVLENTKV